MSKITDFNLESFNDGTIRLSFTGPFSILKKIMADCSSIDELQDSLGAASKQKEENTNEAVLYDPVHIDQLVDATPLSSIELCDLVRIPVIAGDHYVFTDEEIEVISEKTGIRFVVIRDNKRIPIG